MTKHRTAGYLMAALLVSLVGCGGGGPKRMADMSVAQVCAKLSLGTAVEKREAAQHLGDRGDTAAVSALIKALDDPDFKVRTAAARALGRLRDGSAVGPLVKILKGGDPLMAYDVVEALARIGEPSAIAALLEAEARTDEDFADIAKRIREDFLPDLLGKEKIPLLRALAKDGPPGLRKPASEYLEKLYEKYPDSRPAPTPSAEPTPTPEPSSASVATTAPPAIPASTPGPTARPTRRPTPRPTARPTRRPTPRPTRRPPVMPDGAGYTDTEPVATAQPTSRPAPPPPVAPDDQELYGELLATRTPSPPASPPPAASPISPARPTHPDGSRAYRPASRPAAGDRDRSSKWFRAAWQEEQAGHVESAVEKYRLAVQADPSYPDPAFNLGVLLTRNSRLAEAELAYKQSLAADPDQPEVRFNLGLVLYKLGRFRESAEELALAVQGSSAVREWWTQYGRALEKAGFRDAGVDAMLQAAARGDPSGAWEAGHLLLAEGSFQRAAQAYATSVRLGRKGPDPHYNEGVAYYKAKDLDRAAPAFMRALQVDPDHGPSHFSLAAIYLTKRDRQAASRHIARARAAGKDVSQLEAALARLR